LPGDAKRGKGEHDRKRSARASSLFWGEKNAVGKKKKKEGPHFELEKKLSLEMPVVYREKIKRKKGKKGRKRTGSRLGEDRHRRRSANAAGAKKTSERSTAGRKKGAA